MSDPRQSRGPPPRPSTDAAGPSGRSTPGDEVDAELGRHTEQLQVLADAGAGAEIGDQPVIGRPIDAAGVTLLGALVVGGGLGSARVRPDHVAQVDHRATVAPPRPQTQYQFAPQKELQHRLVAFHAHPLADGRAGTQNVEPIPRSNRVSAEKRGIAFDAAGRARRRVLDGRLRM